jgi:hypothetical protein
MFTNSDAVRKMSETKQLSDGRREKLLVEYSPTGINVTIDFRIYHISQDGFCWVHLRLKLAVFGILVTTDGVFLETDFVFTLKYHEMFEVSLF